MKKVKKILIGTHNQGKYKEISQLLPKEIKKVSPINLKIKSPKETGKSFLANSKLKANYFFRKSNIPSLSDDSGLCIECLNGKPGIYSARWANKHGSFQKAMVKILSLVEKKNRNKKRKNFRAKFVCCLTFKISSKKIISVTGEARGKISGKIIGKKGFGYDPIFIPNKFKVTYAQMNKKRKIMIDHRYLAFKKLKKKLVACKFFIF